MEGAKPKRRGRQPEDISKLKYTPDQLRLKLAKYVTGKNIKPTPGMAKSTTIRMREIAMIAELPYRAVTEFRTNGGKLSPGQLKRLIYAIDLCDSGRVVKTQSCVYTIHDEPQTEPAREMRVDVFGGRILKGVTVATAEKPMPSFKKLFQIG